MRLFVCLFTVITLAGPAIGEVLKSDTGGFILQHSATVNKPPQTVFSTLTSEVGKWWNPEHSFSLDAGNMLVDQDCFCERWDGNLVVHLDTVIWMENSKVVLSGGLGPLKDLGLSGTMIWALKPIDAEQTVIAWKYYVNGFSDADLAGLAPVVDGVLAEQIGRLVDYLKP